MPWLGLYYAIVSYPGHFHLLFHGVSSTGSNQVLNSLNIESQSKEAVKRIFTILAMEFAEYTLH